MTRKTLALSFGLFALCLTIACGSGGGTPAGPIIAYPSPGPYTLLTTGSPTVSVPGLGGTTMTVSLPAGGGSVNVSSSTTAPSGTALTFLDKKGAVATPTPTPTPLTNAPQIYFTVTATSATTLNGHPGFSLAFPTVPAGNVYEAVWDGTNWVTVNGRRATISGTTATLTSTTLATPITLASGASLYYVIYTGYSVPTPTPSPTPNGTPAPLNAVQNSDFETGSIAPWYVCYAPHTARATSVDPNPSPQVIPEPTQSPGGTTLGQTIETPSTDVAISDFVPNGNVLGSYSAQVGHYTTGAGSGRSKGLIGICQDVDVPAINPTLTLQVYEGGNVTSISGSDTEADVFSGATWVPSTTAGGSQTTTGSPTPLFAEENCYNNNNTSGGSFTNGVCAVPAVLTSEPGGQWRQKGPYSLSAYAGTQVTIFLGLWSATTSTGYYDYAFFDNVVVTGS